MSRAYRLKVTETLRRVVRAEDHVSTELEILEILPREEMSGLLAGELERRGFQKGKEGWERTLDSVTVVVNPNNGEVMVTAEVHEEISIEGKKQGVAYDDWGTMNKKKVKEELTRTLRRDLEDQADRQESSLQHSATDKLEAQLGDLRAELDQVVNRVTAEGLKIKAARMGQIKEMTEDPQTGNLTIVVEV